MIDIKLKKVWFDGHDLSNLVFIDDFRKNMYDNDGIKVEVDFTIIDNVLQITDDLNRILHTNEPKYLEYSELPGRKLLCQLDGEVNPEIFKNTYRGTLTFKSELNYWEAVDSLRVFNMQNGVIHVNNQGTAPVYPTTSVLFKSECGYLSLVAPNGMVTFGNIEEKDKVKLPEQELMMNEEMDEASMKDGKAGGLTSVDWHDIIRNEYKFDIVNNNTGELIKSIEGTWFPDYNKLHLSSGNVGHDQYGLILKKPSDPKIDYWNATGYRATYRESQITQKTIADNFKFESRLSFYDASGKTTNTGMFLITILDVDNRPIMTTSIYNINSNNNEVFMTTKVNSFVGDNKSSKIIETAKFPNGFNGKVEMIKDGNYFKWVFDSYMRNQPDVTYQQREVFDWLKKGDTCYIKNSARYGYGHNNGRHTIKDFTRGRAYTIQASRYRKTPGALITNEKGEARQHLINYAGQGIYWMNETDLTVNKDGSGTYRNVPVQNTGGQGETRKVFHRFDSELGKMRPSRVAIVGGTWSNGNPFDHASINSVKMWRLNGFNSWHEIRNVFQPNDLLTVDHRTGELRLNGATYDGPFDVDSRFFALDYGKSDIAVKYSDWAKPPTVITAFEERYR